MANHDPSRSTPYDENPDHIQVIYSIITEPDENLKDFGDDIDRRTTIYYLLEINNGEEIWNTAEGLPQTTLEEMEIVGAYITDIGVGGIVEGSDAEVGPYWLSNCSNLHPTAKIDEVKADWESLVNSVKSEQQHLWYLANTMWLEIYLSRNLERKYFCSLTEFEDQVEWQRAPEDIHIKNALEKLIVDHHLQVVTNPNVHSILSLDDISDPSQNDKAFVFLSKPIELRINGFVYRVIITRYHPEDDLLF